MRWSVAMECGYVRTSESQWRNIFFSESCKSRISAQRHQEHHRRLQTRNIRWARFKDAAPVKRFVSPRRRTWKLGISVAWACERPLFWQVEPEQGNTGRATRELRVTSGVKSEGERESAAPHRFEVLGRCTTRQSATMRDCSGGAPPWSNARRRGTHLAESLRAARTMRARSSRAGARAERELAAAAGGAAQSIDTPQACGRFVSGSRSGEPSFVLGRRTLAASARRCRASISRGPLCPLIMAPLSTRQSETRKLFPNVFCLAYFPKRS